MPTVYFGSTAFDADLIIFDKDGTLIDSLSFWSRKTSQAIDRLARQAEQEGPPISRDRVAPHFDLEHTRMVRQALLHAFGYHPETGQLDAQSPVITAATSTLYTIAATVLYQQGWPWLAAELLVAEHFAGALENLTDPAMYQPTADLTALFGALHAAGIDIAVVTSDDHAPTVAALAWSGVQEYVPFLIAADDPYPHKPAPEALLAVCDHYGVDPARAVMVGDSTTDLLMAQRAGLGLRVGVLTGVMDAATLGAHAQVLLDSIVQISTIPSTNQE